MITITYEIECHCGGTASSSTLHLDQPEEDGRVHLDLQMIAEQVDLLCDGCRCVTATGDLDLLCEEECSDEDEDDDT